MAEQQRRILFLSKITGEGPEKRHSDITDLLRSRGIVFREGTSGQYAIHHPDPSAPGMVERVGRARRMTPLVEVEVARRDRVRRQDRADRLRRAEGILANLAEADAVVAEITLPCVQLGILLERAAARGLPVLCIRRRVIELPHFEIIECDPRFTLVDVLADKDLPGIIAGFFDELDRQAARAQKGR